MQRYFSNKKIDNILFINEEDIHHIKNVMRKKQGDLIEVVFDNKAFVAKIENDYKKVTIVKELNEKNNSLNVSLLVPILN